MTTYRSEPWDWEIKHLSNIEKAWARRYQADVSLRHQVEQARKAGVTWEHIGEVLGVTRQAAQAKFGRATLFTTKL